MRTVAHPQALKGGISTADFTMVIPDKLQDFNHKQD
jgi:hypothetical protein